MRVNVCIAGWSHQLYKREACVYTGLPVRPSRYSYNKCAVCSYKQSYATCEHQPSALERS
jgi:hypothetical protein